MRFDFLHESAKDENYIKCQCTEVSDRKSILTAIKRRDGEPQKTQLIIKWKFSFDLFRGVSKTIRKKFHSERKKIFFETN